MRSFLFIVSLSFSLCTRSQVSVVSWNIRYDHAGDSLHAWADRKQPMADWLQNSGAEVIGIQEGLFHQVQFLDYVLTNFTYVGAGREDGALAGEFSAIFIDTTRFFVLESSTFWLSETPGEVSVGWDAALPRVCTYALIQDKRTNKMCWVFNTHFDHMGGKAREEAARLIVSRIAVKNNTTRCPVVLTGDLNAEPKDPPLKVLGAIMSDGYISFAPHAVRGTWNAFDCEQIHDKRIDYIMVNGTTFSAYDHILLCDPEIGALSDHWPVLAELRF